MTRVVALVPAKDRADLVGDTVRALIAVAAVDEVLVIDDGSVDGTTAAAAEAGARVLHLPRNVGKGGAVTAGVEATPEADVYLLVDADTASTAALAAALLPPVVAGEAEMTIAVPPSAGRRGGFGRVKALAAWGIARASGFRAAAPLSGQRAITAPRLRRLLPLADRFGMETALTIDAVRAGARVLEIEVAIEHRHTGRSLAGFRHRAGQGIDISRALWPRLTTRRARIAVTVAAFVVVTSLLVWSGSRWEPASQALAAPPSKVVIFGVPYLDIADVGTGSAPNLDRLVQRGAVGAMSVYTYRSRPSTTEAYATLGAGTRLHGTPGGGVAYDADTPVADGRTARDLVTRQTGRRPRGDIVVPGGVAERQANGESHGAALGGLGQALVSAHRRTAVVTNADRRAPGGHPIVWRPAGLALVDDSLGITTGSVGSDLLEADPSAPFGVRADAAAFEAASRAALAAADVVVIDPGDLDRAAAAPDGESRLAAIRHTDEILGRVIEQAGPRALVIVASLTPGAGGAHVTPVVIAGPGVPHGYLHSPSTKRVAVVTITDLAPTVLSAVDVAVPARMVGQPLRYQPARPDLGMLRTIDRDSVLRDRIGNPITIPFVIFQVLVYLFMAGLVAFRGGAGAMGRWLRLVVLAIAALPLAGLLFRALPGMSAIGPRSLGFLFVLDGLIVTASLRARRYPLSPLLAIMATTAVILVIDVATGVHLLTASYIGYPLSGAGRFFGLGNAAFAVLSSCAILSACLHLHHAPRRDEALVTVTLALAVVFLADTAPTMGDDVGGALTLVPVLGLMLWVLFGRRLSWRPVVGALVATAAAVGVLALVDAAQAPHDQTHVARFFTGVHSGGRGALWSTFLRRTGNNLTALTASFWTAIVPLLVLGLIYLLLRNRRWREVIPAGPLRMGAVAAFSAGLIGFAANDSGVIVPGLVFVFVGPYLTLLALDHEAEKPQLVTPAPTTGPAASIPAVSS
ncbi:MAG: hypothetical protein QOG03_1447 [Actinomycetota bacterium]|jgi:hypothetical protein|nr:hypothetical protein [Actinomycetota bacterium]